MTDTNGAKAAQTLSFTVDAQKVAVCRFTRPQRRNPFDAALREEFLSVVQTVQGDPAIRALVIAGSDGAFCAGGDLKDMHARLDEGPAYWRERVGKGQHAIAALMDLDRPVIAVVDGPAVGAGFSLALAADIVLAGPRARFALSFLKLGLVPDMGLFYTLPRAVGLQRARELIYSARELSAEEALQLNLVLELLPSEQVEARAMAIARSFGAASPVALAHAKAALSVSFESDRAVLFEREAAAQAAAFDTPYPRAAIECLLNRQPPAFQWPPS